MSAKPAQRRSRSAVTRAAYVDRMRAANIARIRSSLADPDWMAARLLNDTAFAGHPYAMNIGGTPTSLNKITAADMKNWTQAHLDRAHLLVVRVESADGEGVIESQHTWEIPCEVIEVAGGAAARALRWFDDD